MSTKKAIFVCPKCGGPKNSAASKSCRPCAHSQARTLVRYEACIDCGKAKTGRQWMSPRCYPCKVEAQKTRIPFTHCQSCGKEKGIGQQQRANCWECHPRHQMTVTRYEFCAECKKSKVGNEKLYSICRNCSDIKTKRSISGLEEELLVFVGTLTKETLVRRNRRLLGGREIDILVPSLSLGFEFNGDYWHSEQFHKTSDKYPTARSRHEAKFEDALNAGVTLAFVWQYDWITNRPQIESAIQSFLEDGIALPILRQMDTPSPYFDSKEKVV